MLYRCGVFERDQLKCLFKVRARQFLGCAVRFNVAVVRDVSEFTATDLAKDLTGVVPDPCPDIYEFNHFLRARASWHPSAANNLADFARIRYKHGGSGAQRPGL